MVVDWLLGIGLQFPAPLLTFGLPVFGGGRGGKLLAVCCDCAGLRLIKFGAEMDISMEKNQPQLNWNVRFNRGGKTNS